jgi:redox-sensitive bicupin YhaK (pirin superfamily)
VQVARGEVTLNGRKLAEGDGAAVDGEPELSFTGSGSGGAEFLFFDLA